jgi:hypothetical protein
VRPDPIEQPREGSGSGGSSHPPEQARPRILIDALPQDQMRYDTLGDWFYDDQGNTVIQVVGADPFDDDQAFLIVLHELVECKLAHKRGITQGAVDAFDFAFTGEGEPGDDPSAPYRREHRFAMLIEHLMARELGIEGYGKVE